MDVSAWLKGLGLECYVPAFRDNEIDWEALPKLTAEDLKDLGVVLGGHRRKLLDAIAALGAGIAAARDAPAPADAERRQLTVMFCRAGRNLTKAEWARYIGSDTPWQPSCRDRPSNWRTPD